MKKGWKADLTYNSFKDLFYDNLSKTGDFQEAYNMSEDEHEAVFNKRRYSGVDSFRVQLSKKKKR
jgi:hypothetical protein